MTPARKAALQWIHDRGEVKFPVRDSDRPSDAMIARLIADGQLDHDAHRHFGERKWSLTDRGRRMLHGDSE